MIIALPLIQYLPDHNCIYDYPFETGPLNIKEHYSIQMHTPNTTPESNPLT